MITDPVLKNKMILIHGAMMAFVWLIAVPSAILLSMYARKKRKSWGPKAHMLIMASAAFIPYTVSAILAFTVAGQIKPKPHSVSIEYAECNVMLILQQSEHWYCFILWFMVPSSSRRGESPCIQI